MGRANRFPALHGFEPIIRPRAGQVHAAFQTQGARVAPGFLRTAMTDTLPDAQTDALNARIPMGRMGEGEDIGAAVAYLATYVGGHAYGLFSETTTLGLFAAL